MGVVGNGYGRSEKRGRFGRAKTWASNSKQGIMTFSRDGGKSTKNG